MRLFKPNPDRLYTKKNVKGLIRALNDRDPKVRKRSAELLGELKDKYSIRPLVAALKDNDWNFLSTVVGALGEIGDKEAVLPLVRFLREVVLPFHDVESYKMGLPSIGEDADRALQKIGLPADPAIQAQYHAAKKDWYGAVQYGNEAVEPLLEALKLEDIHHRREVALALVMLYKSGKLDEPARQKILLMSDQISQPHSDGGGQCAIPHMDSPGFSL